MCLTCSSAGAEKGQEGKGERESNGNWVDLDIKAKKTKNLRFFPSTSVKVSNCRSAATMDAFISCFALYRCGKAAEHHLKYFWEGAAKLLGVSLLHANSLFCSVGAYKCYSSFQPFVWLYESCEALSSAFGSYKWRWTKGKDWLRFNSLISSHCFLKQL